MSAAAFLRVKKLKGGGIVLAAARHVLTVPSVGAVSIGRSPGASDFSAASFDRNS